MNDRDSVPGTEIFLFSTPLPDQLWGRSSLLFNGYRRLSPEIKRPGREANHTPPSNAEVKNAWSYKSTPPYVFMEWYLIKLRLSFHDMVLR
jgi:hypothetical protein